MNNNNLAMAITQIKNASASNKYFVVLKNYSKLIENTLICIKENGYIKDYKKYISKNNKISLIVHLSYIQKNNMEVYGKDYSVNMSIDDFYEKNKDNIFDMNKKIQSPKASSRYINSIKEIKTKSKGSSISYSSYNELFNHRSQYNSFGISIITTSKGVMSHVDAIKNKVGGKILAEVY